MLSVAKSKYYFFLFFVFFIAVYFKHHDLVFSKLSAYNIILLIVDNRKYVFLCTILIEFITEKSLLKI